MAWLFNGATSWLRRTWIWNKFHGFVQGIQNAVGFKQKRITGPQTNASPLAQDQVQPGTASPQPPGADLHAQEEQQSDARDELEDDLLVSEINTALEDAVPRPAASQNLTTPFDSHGTYDNRVGQLDNIYSRVAAGSKRPSKPKVDAKPKVEKPKVDADAPIDGYDNLIVEYAISTLLIALPQPDRSIPSTWIAFQRPDSTNADGNVVQISNHPGLSGSPVNNPVPPTEGIFEPEEEALRINYRNWNRELYSNLGLDRSSIRLVEIQPGSLSDDISVTMKVYPLREIAMQYEALSYVWGNPEPAKKIFVNEVEVSVNPNLYNALISLRQHDSIRRIWIDAICLNQMSKAERSKEVPKMGQIYSLAKMVNVFLGTPSPSNSNVIESLLIFLNRNNANEETVSLSKDELKGFNEICEGLGLDVHDVCKGFVETCIQPWWGRIWTLQEFYLAKEEPTWYWGRSHTSNASLKRDFNLLMNSSWNFFSSEDADGNDLSDLTSRPDGLFKNDVERISTLISRRHKTHGFDNPRRLYRGLTASATDPHDFVYGLRAIFNPVFGRVFVPDYNMRTELLFATLAIFLIQFESWSDVLWWYPSRYEAGKKTLPSWLPNFTRHVQLHELDVRPLEQEIQEKPETKLVVLNHLLHAEGYVLDSVYGHRHIDNCDGQKILEELWQHDHSLNNNHECHEYFIKGASPEEPWLKVFLDMYGSFYAKWTQFSSASRGAVIQTTIRREDSDKLPTQIAECVPWWDILRWHALRTAMPGLPETLGEEIDNASPGCLENIFSSRMNAVFLKAFADFFMGACIFDWAHFSVLLRRFVNATPWCQSNTKYWTEMQETCPNDVEKRKKAIADAYTAFEAEIQPEIMRVGWCSSFYYTFFAYVILLDCDNHASLANIISELQTAAERLRDIYFSITPENLEDMASEVPSIATRSGYCKTILDLFHGRRLIWTDGGFCGITCPGVDSCCDGKSIVAIVDGLSFPLIVLDYDEKTGEGWLAGCAVLRGVDMLGRDSDNALLPPDYQKGEKRVFKFR